MQIIVISFPEYYEDEHEILTQLFEQGLDTFHIRKPGISDSEMRAYILQIPAIYHDKIVLHQHHELAFEFSLKGIHFGESEFAEEHIPHMNWEAGLQLSRSFHDLSQLGNYDPCFRYVFLSPIFDSISKELYKAAFDENEIKKALRETLYHVIALGGVNIANIRKAKEMGFSGAALLGSIWLSDDPVQEFAAIMNSVTSINDLKR